MHFWQAIGELRGSELVKVLKQIVEMLGMLENSIGEIGVSWTKIYIFGYHGSFSHSLFEVLCLN